MSHRLMSRLMLTGVAAVLAVAAATTSASAQTRSLYDRLGGYDAIQAVVDESIKNIAADKRINRFFAGANIPRLRRQLADQICVAAGGPCIYTGKDMKSAHAGMNIRNSQFNALVQDVGKALNKFKVPKREQKELVAALGGTRQDIVTRR
jgi:hemoglobin